MRLPLQTAGNSRHEHRVVVVSGNSGIALSDFCNFDCKVCNVTSGAKVCWDDPGCLARAAACRATDGETSDTCAAWHAAASAACVATAPGYLACKVAADAAYAACLAQL